MYDKVFESIIEITKNQDSDEFSLSIVATIAEIIPEATVALCKYDVFSDFPFQCITSLSIELDDQGHRQYHWGKTLLNSSTDYIKTLNIESLTLNSYQTKDGRYHAFIPIEIENKLAYGIEISSQKCFEQQLDVLVAITKVCQNFYAVLACSEKDSLTGLYNRRTYDSKLNTLLKSQRSNQAENKAVDNEGESRFISHQSHTWLAIFDIDFFKKINDRFGHLYGDEVLLMLSQMMQKSFRQNDLLFRFGGEEFIVIFEPISQEQAEKKLNDFREMLAQHEFPILGHITVSCGFAKIHEHDHPKTVFDNADKALYYAKEHGRNRVCCFETLNELGLVDTHIEEGDIELF